MVWFGYLGYTLSHSGQPLLSECVRKEGVGILLNAQATSEVVKSGTQ